MKLSNMYILCYSGLNIHVLMNDDELQKKTVEENTCFSFPQFEVLICQTCSKSFRTAKELVRHMKSHIGRCLFLFDYDRLERLYQKRKKNVLKHATRNM